MEAFWIFAGVGVMCFGILSGFALILRAQRETVEYTVRPQKQKAGDSATQIQTGGYPNYTHEIGYLTEKGE